MGLGLSKQKYSPIGIDFGAETLKMLQIVPGDPPQMVAAGARQIPKSVRKNPLAHHSFIANAIRDLHKSQRFKGRRAICSIPAFQTLVQHMEVGRCDEHELDEQVRLQLRQRLNVDPSQMILRNIIVGRMVRDGGAMQEILCLAASREAVMRYIDTTQRARLQVVGMHAEPLAISAAFGHLYRRQSDTQRSICFIDIGAAATKVMIAHGRKMVFAKNIHVAGYHLAGDQEKSEQNEFAQSRAARIKEPAAKREKRSANGSKSVAASNGTGNSMSSSTTATSLDNPPQGDDRSQLAVMEHPEGGVGAIESDALGCLIDELQLCIRYHQSVFTDRRIEKLVFLGGESHHVNNCQRIAKSLRIAAQLGDPLARLMGVRAGGKPAGVDMRQPQPAWAVPYGLCLSEPNL